MKMKKISMMIFKAVALGMGVTVVVLSIMKQLEVNAAMSMLGIGLASLAIAGFQDSKE